MLVLLKRNGMRRFFSSGLFTCPIKMTGRTLSGQMVILTGRYSEPCDVNMNTSYWDGFWRKEGLMISLLLMLVGVKENNTSLFFKLFSLGKLPWEPIDQESRRVRMAQHGICQKLYNHTLEVIKREKEISKRACDIWKNKTSTAGSLQLSSIFATCSGLFHVRWT